MFENYFINYRRGIKFKICLKIGCPINFFWLLLSMLSFFGQNNKNTTSGETDKGVARFYRVFNRSVVIKNIIPKRPSLQKKLKKSCRKEQKKLLLASIKSI